MKNIMANKERESVYGDHGYCSFWKPIGFETMRRQPSVVLTLLRNRSMPKQGSGRALMTFSTSDEGAVFSRMSKMTAREASANAAQFWCLVPMGAREKVFALR